MKTSLKRWLAGWLVVCFFITNDLSMPASYAASKPEPAQKTGAKFPTDLRELKIPAEIGKVDEFWQGASGRPAAILIQDAHTLPEAQRNIEKLINYLEIGYGIRFVGVEGSYGNFDSQFFRSFPDGTALKKTFDEYMNSGELTGAAAAAFTGSGNVEFEGIEDWPLYEQGFALFRQAAGETAGASRLDQAEISIEERKKEIFGASLLEVDQALTSFEKNQDEILKVLEVLAKYKKPAKNSTLDLVLREKFEDSGDKFQSEIKKAAEKAEAFLKSRKNSKGIAEEERHFHEQAQAWRTALISSEAFAVELQKLVPGLVFSGNLGARMDSHKRLKDLEGTKFFKEFKDFSVEVLQGLAESQEQRDLLNESRRHLVFRKLAKLELSREDWEELQAMGGPALEFQRDFASHMAFYRNAAAREQAMGAHFSKRIAEKKAGVLVLGGFHAQGMAALFKKAGISYVVVRPEISSVPDELVYRRNMNGEVSWKEYLRADNGKINPYQAFARGARDRLLKKSNEPDALLKSWRDQIIRDLAAEEKVSSARDYTRFIDEAVQPESGELRKKWLNNIDEFVQSIKSLEERGQLTEQSVLNLLRPSGIPDPYTAAAPAPRSELRMGIIPPLPPEVSAVTRPDRRKYGTDNPSLRRNVRIAASFGRLEKIMQLLSSAASSDRRWESLKSQVPQRLGEALTILKSLENDYDSTHLGPEFIADWLMRDERTKEIRSSTARNETMITFGYLAPMSAVNKADPSMRSGNEMWHAMERAIDIVVKNYPDVRNWVVKGKRPIVIGVPANEARKFIDAVNEEAKNQFELALKTMLQSAGENPGLTERIEAVRREVAAQKHVPAAFMTLGMLEDILNENNQERDTNPVEKKYKGFPPHLARKIWGAVDRDEPIRLLGVTKSLAELVVPSAQQNGAESGEHDRFLNAHKRAKAARLAISVFEILSDMTEQSRNLQVVIENGAGLEGGEIAAFPIQIHHSWQGLDWDYPADNVKINLIRRFQEESRQQVTSMRERVIRNGQGKKVLEDDIANLRRIITKAEILVTRDARDHRQANKAFLPYDVYQMLQKKRLNEKKQPVQYSQASIGDEIFGVMDTEKDLVLLMIDIDNFKQLNDFLTSKFGFTPPTDNILFGIVTDTIYEELEWISMHDGRGPPFFETFLKRGTKEKISPDIDLRDPENISVLHAYLRWLMYRNVKIRLSADKLKLIPRETRLKTLKDAFPFDYESVEAQIEAAEAGVEIEVELGKLWVPETQKYQSMPGGISRLPTGRWVRADLTMISMKTAKNGLQQPLALNAFEWIGNLLSKPGNLLDQLSQEVDKGKADLNLKSKAYKPSQQPELEAAYDRENKIKKAFQGKMEEVFSWRVDEWKLAGPVSQILYQAGKNAEFTAAGASEHPLNTLIRIEETARENIRKLFPPEDGAFYLDILQLLEENGFLSYGDLKTERQLRAETALARAELRSVNKIKVDAFEIELVNIGKKLHAEIFKVIGVDPATLNSREAIAACDECMLAAPVLYKFLDEFYDSYSDTDYRYTHVELWQGWVDINGERKLHYWLEVVNPFLNKRFFYDPLAGELMGRHLGKTHVEDITRTFHKARILEHLENVSEVPPDNWDGTLPLAQAIKVIAMKNPSSSVRRTDFYSEAALAWNTPEKFTTLAGNKLLFEYLSPEQLISRVTVEQPDFALNALYYLAVEWDLTGISEARWELRKAEDTALENFNRDLNTLMSERMTHPELNSDYRAAIGRVFEKMRQVDSFIHGGNPQNGPLLAALEKKISETRLKEFLDLVGRYRVGMNKTKRKGNQYLYYVSMFINYSEHAGIPLLEHFRQAQKLSDENVDQMTLLFHHILSGYRQIVEDPEIRNMIVSTLSKRKERTQRDAADTYPLPQWSYKAFDSAYMQNALLYFMNYINFLFLRSPEVNPSNTFFIKARKQANHLIGEYQSMIEYVEKEYDENPEIQVIAPALSLAMYEMMQSLLIFLGKAEINDEDLRVLDSLRNSYRAAARLFVKIARAERKTLEPVKTREDRFHTAGSLIEVLQYQYAMPPDEKTPTHWPDPATWVPQTSEAVKGINLIRDIAVKNADAEDKAGQERYEQAVDVLDTYAEIFKAINSLDIPDSTYRNRKNRAELRTEPLAGVERGLPVSFFLQAFGIDPKKARVIPFSDSKDFGYVRIGPEPLSRLFLRSGYETDVRESLEQVFSSVPIPFGAPDEKFLIDMAEPAYVLTYKNIPAAVVAARTTPANPKIAFYPLLEMTSSQMSEFSRHGNTAVYWRAGIDQIKPPLPDVEIENLTEKIRELLKKYYKVEDFNLLNITEVRRSVTQATVQTRPSSLYGVPFEGVFNPAEGTAQLLVGTLHEDLFLKDLAANLEAELGSPNAVVLGAGAGGDLAAMAELGIPVYGYDITQIKALNARAWLYIVMREKFGAAAAEEAVKRVKKSLTVKDFPPSAIYTMNVADGVAERTGDFNLRLEPQAFVQILRDIKEHGLPSSRLLFRIQNPEYQRLLQQEGWELEAEFPYPEQISSVFKSAVLLKNFREGIQALGRVRLYKRKEAVPLTNLPSTHRPGGSPLPPEPAAAVSTSVDKPVTDIEGEQFILSPLERQIETLRTRFGEWPAREIKKVLVITKVPKLMMEMILKRTASGNGMPEPEVIFAETADEAKSILKSQAFDLAMIDQNLNGSTGMEFVQNMRKDGELLSSNADMTVVIMTADLLTVKITGKQLMEEGRVLFMKRPEKDIPLIFKTVSGARAELRAVPGEETRKEIKILNSIIERFERGGIKFPERLREDILEIMVPSDGPFSARAVLNLVRIVSNPYFTDEVVENLQMTAEIPGLWGPLDEFILEDVRKKGTRSNTRGAIREVLGARMLLWDDVGRDHPKGYRLLQFKGPVKSDFLLLREDRNETFLVEVKDTLPTVTAQYFLDEILDKEQLRRYLEEVKDAQNRPLPEINGTQYPAPVRVMVLGNASLVAGQVTGLRYDNWDEELEAIRRLFYQKLTELFPDEDVRKYFTLELLPTLSIFAAENEEQEAYSRRKSLNPDVGFQNFLTGLYAREDELDGKIPPAEVSSPKPAQIPQAAASIFTPASVDELLQRKVNNWAAVFSRLGNVLPEEAVKVLTAYYLPALKKDGESQKKNELSAREQQLRKWVNPSGFTSPEGLVIGWSKLASEITGRAEVRSLDLRIDQRVPEDRPAFLEAYNRGVRSETRIEDRKAPTGTFPGRMDPARPVVEAIAEALANQKKSVYRFADFGNGYPLTVTYSQANWMGDVIHNLQPAAVVDFTGFDQINSANYVLDHGPKNWVAFIRQQTPESKPELVYGYSGAKGWFAGTPKYLKEFSKALINPQTAGKTGLTLTRDPFTGYDSEFKKLKFKAGKLSDGLGGAEPESFDYISAYNVLQYYPKPEEVLEKGFAPFIKDRGFFLAGIHQNLGDVLLRLYQKRNGSLVHVRDFIHIGNSRFGHPPNKQTLALGHDSLGSLLDEWGNPAENVLKRKVPGYLNFSKSNQKSVEWMLAAPGRLDQYRNDLAAQMNATGLYKARVTGEFIELIDTSADFSEASLAEELRAMGRSELRTGKDRPELEPVMEPIDDKAEDILSVNEFLASDFKGPEILGGTGALASYVAKQSAQKGEKVAAIFRAEDSPRFPNLQRVSKELSAAGNAGNLVLVDAGDIFDPMKWGKDPEAVEKLKKVLAKSTVIYHLAAQTSTRPEDGQTYQDFAVETFGANVFLTKVIARMASELSIPMVYTSSGFIFTLNPLFASPIQGRVTEDTPIPFSLPAQQFIEKANADFDGYVEAYMKGKAAVSPLEFTRGFMDSSRISLSGGKTANLPDILGAMQAFLTVKKEKPEQAAAAFAAFRSQYPADLAFGWYPISKILSEKDVLALPQGKGQVVRLVNLYGEGLRSNTAVNLFLNSLAGQKATGYADNVMRDFIPAQDAAEILSRVAANAVSGKFKTNEIIHAASRQGPYTMKQVFMAAASSLGIDLKKYPQPVKAFEDVPGLVMPSMSTEKLKRMTGYEPETSLEEGVSQLVRRLFPLRARAELRMEEQFDLSAQGDIPLMWELVENSFSTPAEEMLQNAAKASWVQSMKKGRVITRVKVEGDDLVVSVDDTGPGFDIKQLKKAAVFYNSKIPKPERGKLDPIWIKALDSILTKKKPEWKYFHDFLFYMPAEFLFTGKNPFVMEAEEKTRKIITKLAFQIGQNTVTENKESIQGETPDQAAVKIEALASSVRGKKDKYGEFAEIFAVRLEQLAVNVRKGPAPDEENPEILEAKKKARSVMRRLYGELKDEKFMVGGIPVDEFIQDIPENNFSNALAALRELAPAMRASSLKIDREIYALGFEQAADYLTNAGAIEVPNRILKAKEDTGVILSELAESIGRSKIGEVKNTASHPVRAAKYIDTLSRVIRSSAREYGAMESMDAAGALKDAAKTLRDETKNDRLGKVIESPEGGILYVRYDPDKGGMSGRGRVLTREMIEGISQGSGINSENRPVEGIGFRFSALIKGGAHLKDPVMKKLEEIIQKQRDFYPGLTADLEILDGGSARAEIRTETLPGEFLDSQPKLLVWASGTAALTGLSFFLRQQISARAEVRMQANELRLLKPAQGDLKISVAAKFLWESRASRTRSDQLFNVQKALDFFGESPEKTPETDLLFSGHMDENDGGFGLARELRKRGFQLPIVIYSANFYQLSKGANALIRRRTTDQNKVYYELTEKGIEALGPNTLFLAKEIFPMYGSGGYYDLIKRLEKGETVRAEDTAAPANRLLDEINVLIRKMKLSETAKQVLLGEVDHNDLPNDYRHPHLNMWLSRSFEIESEFDEILRNMPKDEAGLQDFIVFTLRLWEVGKLKPEKFSALFDYFEFIRRRPWLYEVIVPFYLEQTRQPARPRLLGEMPAPENTYGTFNNVSRGFNIENASHLGKLSQTLDKMRKDYLKRKAVDGSLPKMKFLVVGAGSGLIIYDLKMLYGDVFDFYAINKEPISFSDAEFKQRVWNTRFAEGARYPFHTGLSMTEQEAKDSAAAFLTEYRQQVITADVEQGLEFPEQSFDGVLIAAQVVTYLKKKLETAQLVKKLLKKDGVGFLTDFDGWNMDMPGFKEKEGVISTARMVKDNVMTVNSLTEEFFADMNAEEGLPEAERQYQFELSYYGFGQWTGSLIINNSHPETTLDGKFVPAGLKVIRDPYGLLPERYETSYVYAPSGRAEVREVTGRDAAELRKILFDKNINPAELPGDIKDFIFSLIPEQSFKVTGLQKKDLIWAKEADTYELWKKFPDKPLFALSFDGQIFKLRLLIQGAQKTEELAFIGFSILNADTALLKGGAIPKVEGFSSMELFLRTALVPFLIKLNFKELQFEKLEARAREEILIQLGFAKIEGTPFWKKPLVPEVNMSDEREEAAVLAKSELRAEGPAITEVEAALILTRYQLGSVQKTEVHSSAEKGNIIFIESDKGKYVLKRPAYRKTKALLEWENSVLEALGADAAQIVKTKDGSLFTETGGNFYVIYEQIEGAEFTWGRVEGEYLQSAARLLASVHERLEKLEPAGRNYTAEERPQVIGVLDYETGLKRLELLYNSLSPRAPPERTEVENLLVGEWGLFSDAVKRIRERLTPAQLAKLPVTIAHADYHQGNMRFLSPNMPRLFDFEYSARDSRLYDLASPITLAYAPDGSSLSFKKVREFVLAYHMENPLTELELELLPEVFLLRYLEGALLFSGMYGKQEWAAIPMREQIENLKIINAQDWAQLKKDAAALRPFGTAMDVNAARKPALPSEMRTETRNFQAFMKRFRAAKIPLDMESSLRSLMAQANAFNGTPEEKVYLMKEYIEVLKKTPGFRELYEEPNSLGLWEKYSLEEHTQMVLGQFLKHRFDYFKKWRAEHNNLPEWLDAGFLMLIFSLHDIGKVFAVKEGDADLQHEYTLQMTAELFDKLKMKDEQKALALALMSGDFIGAYMQRTGSIFDDSEFRMQPALLDAVESLEFARRSNQVQMALPEFFEIFAFFYQSDVLAYTGDAEDAFGKKGKPSLDGLFDLNEVAKQPFRTSVFKGSDYKKKPESLERFELLRRKIRSLDESLFLENGRMDAEKKMEKILDALDADALSPKPVLLADPVVRETAQYKKILEKLDLAGIASSYYHGSNFYAVTAAVHSGYYFLSLATAKSMGKQIFSGEQDFKNAKLYKETVSLIPEYSEAEQFAYDIFNGPLTADFVDAKRGREINAIIAESPEFIERYNKLAFPAVYGTSSAVTSRQQPIHDGMGNGEIFVSVYVDLAELTFVYVPLDRIEEAEAWLAQVRRNAKAEFEKLLAASPQNENKIKRYEKLLASLEKLKIVSIEKMIFFDRLNSILSTQSREWEKLLSEEEFFNLLIRMLKVRDANGYDAGIYNSYVEMARANWSDIQSYLQKQRMPVLHDQVTVNVRRDDSGEAKPTDFIITTNGRDGLALSIFNREGNIYWPINSKKTDLDAREIHDGVKKLFEEFNDKTIDEILNAVKDHFRIQRSELRMTDLSTMAPVITTLAQALYPERTQVNRAELRFAAQKVAAKEIDADTLRLVLAKAVDNALKELAAEKAENSYGDAAAIHASVEPMKQRMLAFFDAKIAEAIEKNPEAKAVVGLDVDAASGVSDPRAPQDYVDILTRYFSGRLEQLRIKGALGAGLTSRLKTSGISQTTQNNLERISSSALMGQSNFPVIFSKEGKHSISNPVVLPVGIRYSGASLNPEAVAMTRFNQTLYAILHALLVRQPEDADKLQKEFLKAMTLRDEFQTQGTVIDLEDGYPTFDAKTMQVLLEMQGRQLAEASA